MQDFQASMIASLASVCVFAPFDVARTKLNVQNMPITTLLKSIYQTEGLKGFYRGLAMSATTTPLSTSLYLALYQKTQNTMKKMFESNTIANLGAATVTGFVCNTITNPLWLLKTRIQTTNKSLFENASEIYKKEGVRGYYRGLGTSYLGLLHLAVYFPLYESLKEKLHETNSENRQKNILIASSAAKLVSLLVSYPNTVLMTKVQISATKMPLLEIGREIYKVQGVSGLFSGLKVELGRSLPANAMTFLLYETLKNNQISAQ